MDDFNREKRIFTISELKDFMEKTLDNYYNMFDDTGSVEFENYEMGHNATVFVLKLDNTGDETEQQEISITKVDGKYTFPLDLSDPEMKNWI